MYTESIEELIHYFSKLPSIGKKTAQRLAFYILKNPADFSSGFADALRRVKEKTQFCMRCNNISEAELCHICSNPKRDSKQIMLVEEFNDIYAIEKTNEFRGTYHVLGGLLSPLDGVGPEQLNFASLLSRIRTDNVKELILGLTPNSEGEATSTYLLRQIEGSKLQISRIARGVPIGTQLDYIDQVTLARAISGRNNLA